MSSVEATTDTLQGVDPSGALDAAQAARTLAQPAFISVLSDSGISSFASLAGDGALAGLPFAVKDNIDVAGIPTTAADPRRSDPAPESAHAVELLIQAGAVPIGKTNLDQYATGLVGTRSPFGICHCVDSVDHVSGGSSSGSAVAVAAGIVPFALATDTAGSGRVPAAFNGIVGFKATRGVVSTAGVFPACRSLDCLTILARSVWQTRQVFDVVASFDSADPFARRLPAATEVRQPRLATIGVPRIDLGMDSEHQRAWEQTLSRASTFFRLVEVDIQPLLDAAAMLYQGPWLAERYLAFGTNLDDSPVVDPTVRQIVLGGQHSTALDLFNGLYKLAEYTRATEPMWSEVDAVLLPVTPTHPTIAAVQSEPIAVNARLGRFTNMANLLDLAAIAVPGVRRSDGLPFGIQFLGPAFSDYALFDIAATWTGEHRANEGSVDSGITTPVVVAREPAAPVVVAPELVTTYVLLAVAGAHLTGQPLNADLTQREGEFVKQTRTAPGYRMFAIAGSPARPGLTRMPATANSQQLPAADGIEVEVWRLPTTQLADFISTIAPPLAIGPIILADGEPVLGFVCTADAVDASRDITAYGSWRQYLASIVD